MTGEKANLKSLKQQILSREAWKPFPKYEDRESWDAVPAYYRDKYLDPVYTDEMLKYVPMIMEASRFMTLYRTGKSDQIYGQNFNKRRQTLLDCVLAECLEGKGRFIDKIIDLVWCICEESSWVGDTHNNHMHNHMLSGVNKNALPDVLDYNFVDLRIAMTGGLLAIVYYFMKDRLDEESPLICKRIELEITKRVFIPFMNHDDMTWMGFWGHKINNWNPWIVANIMIMDLICTKDPDFRLECLARCMEKLDIYINVCPSDGGCDEGPGYWYGAGAALYDCLAILYDASGGRLSFFEEKLIRNIGEYAVKSYMKNGSKANFGDNRWNTEDRPILLYRFGTHVKSDMMKVFAMNRFNAEHQMYPEASMNIYRDLKDLFDYSAMCSREVPAFAPVNDVLPQTQHFYVHSCDDAVQLAAKGGFNNESHNHNDLGHFILSRNGKPIIVDLGNLPYQDKTFSPQRYEIWILTAAWHNCAQINGFEQHDGDEYKAAILSSSVQENCAVFELDLTQAYEKEAGVESYIRKLTFCRTCGELTVEDQVKLYAPGKLTRHFISVEKPCIMTDAVEYDAEDAVLRLSYDAAAAMAEVVVQDLEADSLKASWGKEVCYRTDITEKERDSQYSVKAVFSWTEK